MKKKKVFVINRSVFGYKELKCEENEADFNEIQEVSFRGFMSF